MKKVFHHFSKWEDAKAGMYDLPSVFDCCHAVLLSADLLKSASRFYEVAYKVISEWIFSAEANLSNRNRNRQAWIGQASCCYEFGSKEHQTKQAWHTLSESEKMAANRLADEIIQVWESVYA